MRGLLFLVVAALSGCTYCQSAANKGTVECKAYALLSRCGPGVAEIVIAEAPMFAVDLQRALLELASKLSSTEYGCVVSALEQSAGVKFGVGSAQHNAFRDACKAVDAKRTGK